MKRESGYYWVKESTNWHIAEWDASIWHYDDDEFDDPHFKEINELRILSPEESKIRFLVSKLPPIFRIEDESDDQFKERVKARFEYFSTNNVDPIEVLKQSSDFLKNAPYYGKPLAVMYYAGEDLQIGNMVYLNTETGKLQKSVAGKPAPFRAIQNIPKDSLVTLNTKTGELKLTNE